MVYKRNIRIDGKLEFYVIKIVAKGYSLKLCFNYGKPFLIVVILKSIILLLSIAVCLVHEI